MHFVKRGREPAELRAIRVRYTPRWVQFYRYGKGQKPTDDQWLSFQEALQDAFFMLCGYCEELCRGEVDHFKPKSRYPHLVYRWDNWIFSCHDCNHMKGEKFPPGGYINPCDTSASQRPEAYLDFDTLTGEVIPREGLSRSALKKARMTIDDLELNAFHHLKKRLGWLRNVERLLLREAPDDPGHANLIRTIIARDSPFSSMTRAMLARQGLVVRAP